MSTETISARFTELDLWPTGEAVSAMLEGQMAAAATVQSQVAAIARAADEAAARLRDPCGRLIYVGAGTSGRIAVQDGVELGPTFGWPSDRAVFLLAGGMGSLAASAEGAEDDAGAGESAMRAISAMPADVVVAVAASGRTPSTIASVRVAEASGALTIGLANNAASPLLDTVAHPILLDTGAEVVAGSTRMKAGTAQKIALNLFSTAVMVRLGRVYNGLMVDMLATNAKLGERAVEMICAIAGVDPARAGWALEQADGVIKNAALIALGNAPAQSAALIDAAGGNLRVALDLAKAGK